MGCRAGESGWHAGPVAQVNTCDILWDANSLSHRGSSDLKLGKWGFTADEMFIAMGFCSRGFRLCVYKAKYWGKVKVLICVLLFATPWTIEWDSPGQNTGVGCHSLLQGSFPTQGLNPALCTAGRFFSS